MVEISRRGISKCERLKLNAEAKEFLVRLSLQDDGGTVEFPVKERHKCGTIQPTGVDQAESVVNVA
jgi:hypothetical protein